MFARFFQELEIASTIKESVVCISHMHGMTGTKELVTHGGDDEEV